MDEVWVAEENIKRLRGKLAEPCDDGRRNTLMSLLQREEENLRRLVVARSEKNGSSPRLAMPFKKT